MDYKELFRKACLVQLSTSVWRTSKAINHSVLIDKIGEDAEWLRGKKYLIDPTLLGPINTATQQARNTIKKYSLPFPVGGIYLVPKESLSVIDERLQYFEARFWDSYADFEAIYERSMEDAREVLKELFDETDYPVDIRSKFKFQWRYMTVDLPRKTTILSPAIYEREKQRFQEMIEETRETAVAALKEEFSQVVTHLVERLDSNGERPRVISNNMFNKINDFLDDLGTRNLFEDQELTLLAEEARQIINNTNPYSLKYSQNLRDSIRSDMENLKDSLEDSIQDMPRRKLKIDPLPLETELFEEEMAI
ncbi:conserved hypothetical protein [Desulfamplus magnetovallimortis]|uniref:DUF3150 domain-containing protein n=1 Tax=Desulfamplus magnetovallimortis TaxID=1246637 RepID=A0A1W1HE57_9BACT|nr:DUF3150 domain-containing protein [Desulfamplus magnetovallimortis]SLM30777.1 conserved hypothetical protein [Desulfamplus magnetovallimortis]